MPPLKNTYGASTASSCVSNVGSEAKVRFDVAKIYWGTHTVAISLSIYVFMYHFVWADQRER